MRRSYLLLPLLTLVVSLHFTAMPADKGQRAETGPPPEERVFDFGHVGIDFTVYHTFHFVNRTEESITIIKAVSSCDCSAVTTLDSIVKPGDTAFIRLSFSTKDFYGPTKKSFTVFTDHPSMSAVKFSYLSQVGLWFDRIKPDPISLFFLPAHKSKKITIGNHVFDEIRVAVKEQFDTTFDVTLLQDNAAKGQALELEVAPRPDLKRGTYRSSVTLEIGKEGSTDPTILTIPIKIVKY
jgi:hypothetical protein